MLYLGAVQYWHCSMSGTEAGTCFAPACRPYEETTRARGDTCKCQPQKYLNYPPPPPPVPDQGMADVLQGAGIAGTAPGDLFTQGT